MPRAGGSYIFLRESFGRAGRLISFLFLFQILISAPLSLASGCIGFAQYLEPILPIAGKSIPLTATAVCVVIVLLLLRRIDAIGSSRSRSGSACWRRSPSSLPRAFRI
jgi:amino acid transporter